MDQLGKRIASGLILAAAVAGALWLPTPGFAAFLILLLLVAAYEWARLAYEVSDWEPSPEFVYVSWSLWSDGLATLFGWNAYIAGLVALAAALWLAPSAWPWALAVAVTFWAAAMAIVVFFPASADPLRKRGLALLAGAVAIGGGWLGLVALHDSTGPVGVLWLLLAVAAADIGAYFTGRRFGRRKLAPRVSPAKTWEGLAGGGAALFAVAACGALLLPGSLLGWLGAAILALLAATVGDLFESVLKRLAGVKDSGNILPGHGGILDRVDAVLAAAPMLALYSFAMQ